MLYMCDIRNITMDTMVYLEWTDKQKNTHREKLIVYGIPPQFLSAFEANPVSMPSHVHPPLTMEGEGGWWRAKGRQHSRAGGLSMGLESTLHNVCVSVCQ